MLKKLFLVAILILMFAVGGAWGAEENQECKVLANTKLFMMLSANQSSPVMPNMDIPVAVGEEINEGLAEFFTAESTIHGRRTPMDFAGAHIVRNLFDGKLLVVRDMDLIECK